MSTPSSPLVQRLRGVPGGIVLMLLGAGLAAAGLLQTTSSHYNVTSTCVAPSVLVAKYTNVGGSYAFDSPAGNSSVVTITKADRRGGSWTSSRAISSLIVKGGPNNVLVSLSPPQTSGVFSSSWLPKVKGATPDVADVQFCGSSTASTTTAKPATTTTAKPAPSTTAKPVTTTTAKPATTTTAKPATTTTDLYSTTEPPASTTTTAGATTTTGAVGNTSTTTVDPPTTTVAGATTTTRAATTTTAVDVKGSQITAPVTTSTSIVGSSDESGSDLPFTGSSSAPLVAIGLALLLGGGAVTLVAVRRGRA